MPDSDPTHLEKHALEAESLERQTVAHADKHDAEQRAISTALEADRHRLADHRIAHDAAHASHEKLHEAFAVAHGQQHTNEAQAVSAATRAMDKRLDAMNEFRDQLRDQAATFVRNESLQALEKAIRADVTALDKRIDTEREERREKQNLSVGERQGIGQSTAIIIGAVGLIGTILGIVVVLSNVLTTVAP